MLSVPSVLGFYGEYSARMKQRFNSILAGEMLHVKLMFSGSCLVLI